jgi:nitroreductase
MISETIRKNRSYRKYYEEEKITPGVLKELVNLARLSGCGMNMQSLRYLLITEKEDREKIYPNLKWAGFLKDWDGPEKGRRPSAFILVLKDNEKQNSAYVQIDMGIACQSILLGAVEKGLGGCIIAAFNKGDICQEYNIQDNLELWLVIAIGKPDQKVIIDEIDKGADTKYWVDENGNHHVPKIRLEDIIIQR